MIKNYYKFLYIIPEAFLRDASNRVDHHTFLGDISIGVPYDGTIIVCVNCDAEESLDYWLEEWEEYRVKVVI